MGAAWLVPASALGAALGWLSILVLSHFFLVNTRPLQVYLCGCLTYAIGFYWLAETVQLFGGFPQAIALAIFGLFVLVCAGQFSLCAFVIKRLPGRLGSSTLALPFGWVVSQFCWLGIFPWEPGHTQIGFPLFAQSADILGVTLLTFVMWWIGASFSVAVASRGRNIRPLLCCLFPFLLLLAYGYQQRRAFDQLQPDLAVALVQANISISEKSNLMFIEQNVERYIELSNSLVKSANLIVWPESVIQEWVSVHTSHVEEHPLLAMLPKGAAYLIGSLSFESKDRLFNSAFAIDTNGAVAPPYHKRILMPFGEYVPLAGIFPWLRQMTPIPKDFTSGNQVSVFDYPALPGAPRVAPLICYEDILPGLAAQSVRSGATVLVNLTNDAWFGRSPAALQHHQIASFRAIETRRYLLRATNTGITAIVDPSGRTVGSLPAFAEGILQASVAPIDVTTPFVALGDMWSWRIVSWLLLALTLLPTTRRSQSTLN